MTTPLELIHKYISAFRSAVNSKVRSSNKTVRELLRLNSASDWDFLCTAMDIVDDASSAIGHVQTFGLSGATKYNDLGEKYLRLYGLLSATYIQQQSVLKIYQIMNVPHLKKTKKRFDDLEIRSLRHKLSAHSTDYFDRATSKMEAFVPVRIELGDTKIGYVNYTSSSRIEKVDLANAIDAHSKLVVETLDVILAKAIKTLFKGHPSKKNEFEGRLSDLRIEKTGGLVFGANGGPKIIVTFTEAKKK